MKNSASAASRTGHSPKLALCVLAALTVLSGSGCGRQETSPEDALSQQVDRRIAESQATAEILDGNGELQSERLGELALERARLGAGWLSKLVKDDGSFPYRYFPERDEYDQGNYNELRHAGTTYSLVQVYEATRDRATRRAAEKALHYIDQNTLPADQGRVFLYEGRGKLGGQALALLALLEYRRVADSKQWDGLIMDLASFVRSMELKDAPGRYYQSYVEATGERLLEPDSNYYPSENLLAQVRLAQHFPAEGFLEDALRSANYLLHVKDGDIPAKGKVPREDHWLTLALPELDRLKHHDDYRQVTRLQAESMRRNQHGPDQPYPDRIGASSTHSPINYTSTATKGEALLSAWAMEEASGSESAVDKYSQAALRNIQFQMRTQYMPSNTQLFHEPQRLVGAWGQDALRHYVRIDFVQHNISGLIGAWHTLNAGKLPAVVQQVK